MTNVCDEFKAFRVSQIAIWGILIYMLWCNMIYNLHIFYVSFLIVYIWPSLSPCTVKKPNRVSWSHGYTSKSNAMFANCRLYQFHFISRNGIWMQIQSCQWWQFPFRFNRVRCSKPVLCLLLGVSSDYVQPITDQVTEVTCFVSGRAQPELTPSKRHHK